VREDGKRVKSCQDRALQAIIAQLPKKQRAEMEVEWLIDHHPFRLRLITSWNTAKNCFVYLLTNLPQSRDPIEKICLGYKLRWQVELVFKEWKSHANLHLFDPDNEPITESLIWASLAAAAFKRFLAHAAEHLLEVVISTRKAAMMPADVLPELFRSLRHGDGPWFRRAFKAMMGYLGRNAKRAHPQRDARTGRAQRGLQPIFALTEHKAFMDNGEKQIAA
jgi:hypothetical protein